MEEDVVGLFPGMDLEADAQPAVGVAATTGGLGRYRVGEDKEGGAVAAGLGQALFEQAVFMFQHREEPLARNVARGLPVDGVAERHVVG